MLEDFQIDLIIGFENVNRTLALLHTSSRNFLRQAPPLCCHSDVRCPHFTEPTRDLGEPRRLLHVETELTSRFKVLESALSIALDTGITAL